jgi:competence protein ComEC
MASEATRTGFDDAPGSPQMAAGAALQHRPWLNRRFLSSGAADAIGGVEDFLAKAGFDRAPWLAVAFATGIAGWFALPTQWHWLALLALCLAALIGALGLMHHAGRFPHARLGLALLALALGAGCLTAWAKSAMVGTTAIERPTVALLDATVLGREDQPAEDRVRLLLATREPGSGRAIRVRVNVPKSQAGETIGEGARVRLRARLMPPAPPMLPGSYDFARAAWFAGLSATGSALGPIEVLRPAEGQGLARLQRRLAAHVRGALAGSPGGIAAALASGDRGGIAEIDEEAMRDSGLTHLLSVSGLHVSALVATAYLIVLKLLALWPWLALRVRLPLVAAAVAAGAGVAYTLLTGAEVPTVRACAGALLVLAAVALGREPLSLRMLAVAALLVMLLWPEAVVGPSFQMSFAAVIAIVALHGSAPIRTFLAPREEPWWQRWGRRLAMLVLTGVVIELALMPIGLFHFHRSGAYGALANVVGIPLTTFVSMPLIALALLLDTVGAGGPAWWLAGLSLDALLGLAHWTASRPGAVTLLPAMGTGAFALYVAGALWLALWRGRVRLLGALPVAAATLLLVNVRAPDVLVSGDGRHVGITAPGGGLLVLRAGGASYARDTLVELSGMGGEVRRLDQWPGAVCGRDFCVAKLARGERTWRLLIARGRDYVEERALAAACERVDVVIADRRLPSSCRPVWLKADRWMLGRTGGLAIDLERGHVTTVAEGQGEHGWWRTDPGPHLEPAVVLRMVRRPLPRRRRLLLPDPGCLSGSGAVGRPACPEPPLRLAGKSAARKRHWPGPAGPFRSRDAST